MAFKFEKLEVWQRAVDYADAIYALAEQLPSSEAFNLRSQITRASTSISLNIAEGSTGQSDREQARFLSYAIRSLIETVACLHLIRRRGYIAEDAEIDAVYALGEDLFKRLQAFRRALERTSNRVSEPPDEYLSDGTFPTSTH